MCPTRGLFNTPRITGTDPDETLKPLTLDTSRVNFLGL